MNCKQPDRDVPKIVCGYPLPCPYHTTVIDASSTPVTITLPVTANIDPLTANRLKRIGQAVAQIQAEKLDTKTTEEAARLIRYRWAKNGFAPLTAELGISASQVQSLVKAKVIELRSNYEGGPAIYVYLTPKGMRMAQTRRRV